MKKVLAIDYGKKRIGLASGDTLNKVVFPRDVVLNKGSATVQEIFDFCKEGEIDFIVIGLPLNMKNEHAENEIMVEIKRFVQDFRELSGGKVDIEFMDERLSSFEAEKIMEELDVIGSEKLGKDAYAAMIILQRYFDEMS